MELGEASRQFQVALEAHRANPDDEDVWQELKNAEDALLTAWIEAKFAQSPEEDS